MRRQQRRRHGDDHYEKEEEEEEEDDDEEEEEEEDEVDQEEDELDVQGLGTTPPNLWRETSTVGERHRRSIVHQPKPLAGSRGSVHRPKPQKTRRTTLWEALTGLVCSLGALATRAAKLATRRGGEPL